MRLYKHSCLITMLFVYLAGCTQVHVSKVTDPHNPPKGIQYSLPKPFLQVTPTSTGEVTVKVVYLPDPDSRYAIDAYSFASKHTLDVAISNGLLTKVQWNPIASGAFKDAVASSGTVAAKVIETRTAAKKEQAGEAKARRDAAQAKLDTAKKAVEDAKFAVFEANLELKSLPNTATDEDKRPYIVKLEIAKERLRLAEEALDAAQADFEKVSVPALAGGSGTAASSSGDPEFDRLYGPILYAIVESPDDGVRLVAADQPIEIPGEASATSKQPHWPTASASKPPVNIELTLVPPNDDPGLLIVDVRTNDVEMNIDKLFFYKNARGTATVSDADATSLRNTAEVDSASIEINYKLMHQAGVVSVRYDGILGQIPTVAK